MDKRFIAAIFGVCVLLWMLFSSVVSASIIVRMTDEQMVKRADRIVYGRVVRQYSEWDKRQRNIFTHTIIAVLDPIKGDTSTQEVTIRQLGGNRGRIGMRVAGGAQFQLGEEVIVFLERHRGSLVHHHVMGMSFGKYSVLRDPKTNRRYLRRDLHNLAVASWDKRGRFRIQEAATPKAPHAHPPSSPPSSSQPPPSSSQPPSSSSQPPSSSSQLPPRSPSSQSQPPSLASSPTNNPPAPILFRPFVERLRAYVLQLNQPSPTKQPTSPKPPSFK